MGCGKNKEPTSGLEPLTYPLYECAVSPLNARLSPLPQALASSMCRMPSSVSRARKRSSGCFVYWVLLLISYQLGTSSTLQNWSRTVCSRSREVAGRDRASGVATNFRPSSRPGAMRFGVGRDVRSRRPCFRWPQPAPAGSPHGCPCRRSAGAKRSSRSPRAGFPPR